MTTASDNRSVERHRYLRTVFVCAAFTLLAIAMQYRSGAFHSDFSFDADEPAHAVSSLMVHDYLTQSLPANPMNFARGFYAHYSKVAIGHWPPLFYCAEAVWMLLAGRSRIAMLLFVALCGGLLLGSVYCSVRKRTSVAVALISVAVLVWSPVFQNMLCTVRPDLLLALIVFWGAMACAGYIFSGRRSSGILFVVLAVAALFVHERGFVLLLVPFCLLPFCRRPAAWKWIAAGVPILLLIALPYARGNVRHFSVAFLVLQVELLVSSPFLDMGWVATLLASVGAIAVFQPGEHRQFWATMVGLAIACCLFIMLVPIRLDDYYVITLLPALAALSSSGVQVLYAHIQKAWNSAHRPLDVAIFAIALLAVGWGVWRVPAKRDMGYHQLIAECLLCGNDVTLIAADGFNEGALIAEGSLADVKREHTILRGSKVLAQSTWAGNYYRLRYPSTVEVSQFVDQAHVSLVVVQTGANLRADVVQLRSAVAQNTSWKRLGIAVPAGNIEIYRRIAIP